MKKRYIIAGTIALLLFYPFYFIPVNQLMNLLHPVEKSCERDSDCRMYKTECRLCDFYSEGQAVNIEYAPFCLLPKPYFFNCTTEDPLFEKTYKAVCENDACVEKIAIKEPNLILAKNWFEDL